MNLLYKTGGIGPFGQTRKIPVVIEKHALAHDLVYVNGGQRGLQVRLQVPDCTDRGVISSSAERLLHRR